MESATWCRTPAAASAASRLRPDVSKNSSTALSSHEGALARSITTCVPAMASVSPSPVMLLTPALGEAATTSWPPWRRMETAFEPIRPVPPITTIFMVYPPLPMHRGMSNAKVTPAALLLQIVLQFRSGVRKQGTHRWLFRSAVQQAEVVDHPVVPYRGHLDAGGVQLAPVGFALVAQDIAFRDLDERWRQALQLLHRRLQRRGVDFYALLGVGRVEVIHPPHQRRGQEPLLAELSVRFRVEGGVHNRPHHDLQFDGGAALLFGLQGRHGRHISPDAIAHDGQGGAVHPKLLTVRSHPLRRSVDFIDGLWIPGIGRAGIVDEDGGKPGQDDEVTHHPLVRGIIAQYPATAVNEDEHRAWAGGAGGTHDVQGDRVAIRVDGGLRLCNPG